MRRAWIISAIVAKDLREFSRDRLWMILAPISIAFVIAIFWILPPTVDETITVGLYPPELLLALESLGEQEKDEPQVVKIVTFTDKDSLIAAVSGKNENDETPNVAVGIAFPKDFVSDARTGKKTTVSIYMDAALPDRVGRAMTGSIREIAYALQAAAAGKDPEMALPVALPDHQTIILGEDRAGVQVPWREKLRPLMAIIILMIEALVLAGLVAVEIQQRTITAILVTPARTSDVLAAKSITGFILAASQVLLFLIATHSFSQNRFAIAILVCLGAVMFTAVGMISGAGGKDFMGTLFGGMILIIPLIIPALAALFPGSAPLWIKVLPSFGLIDAIFGVFAYGRTLSDVAPLIGLVLAWDIVLFFLALLLLKRKVEAL